jgi:hypothetical protein
MNQIIIGRRKVFRPLPYGILGVALTFVRQANIYMLVSYSTIVIYTIVNYDTNTYLHLWISQIYFSFILVDITFNLL